MRVCVCLNFEDNDTKRQARLWNQVSQRELENLWNQVEKEKRKRKKRAENERAGEIRRKEGSGIKWNVKEKKKDDGILWVYVCGGQNARGKKNEETYG